MTEPIELLFRGHCPSKKNEYSPRKNGKGFFKAPELKAKLDRLIMQVPGDVRGLLLISPGIHFHIVYHTANFDRDSVVTTLLDILVQLQVLKNDNIASCNGLMMVHPAVRGEYDSTKVILIPQEEASSSPRYIDPRRRRLAIQQPEPMAVSPVPNQPMPTQPIAEDLPDWISGEDW